MSGTIVPGTNANEAGSLTRAIYDGLVAEFGSPPADAAPVWRAVATSIAQGIINNIVTALTDTSFLRVVEGQLVGDESGGGGGGGGAPTDAQYIVAASSIGLSAERVATNTTSVTWDFSVAGQARATVTGATTTGAGIVELATSAETSPGLAVQASDSRLSDSRTPLAHASSHNPAGSDPLVNYVAVDGTHAMTAGLTISASDPVSIVGTGAGSPVHRWQKSDAGTIDLQMYSNAQHRMTIRLSSTENLNFIARDTSGASQWTTIFVNSTGDWQFPANATFGNPTTHASFGADPAPPGGDADRAIQVGSTTASQTVGYKAYVNDGVRNPRAMMFLADTFAWGLWQTWSSSGSLPFVLGIGTREFMRVVYATSPADGTVHITNANLDLNGNDLLNCGNFNELVDDRVSSLLSEGPEITITYNDVTNQLEIAHVYADHLALSVWGNYTDIMTSPASIASAAVDGYVLHVVQTASEPDAFELQWGQLNGNASIELESLGAGHVYASQAWSFIGNSTASGGVGMTEIFGAGNGQYPRIAAGLFGFGSFAEDVQDAVAAMSQSPDGSIDYTYDDPSGLLNAQVNVTRIQDIMVATLTSSNASISIDSSTPGVIDLTAVGNGMTQPEVLARLSCRI